MNYCSNCGHKVETKIPADDTRPRFVCPQCATIHYQNPNIVAGTLPVHEGKVLLCRRAIEPRHGFWTLPAGFMENQETTMEAAARETWEEAEARVKLHSLLTLINVPQIDQVHVYFLATLIDGKFGAGPESLESALFDEKDIPWDELAFPTVSRTLKRYFEDRKSGVFTPHVSDMARAPREAEFPTDIDDAWIY